MRPHAELIDEILDGPVVGNMLDDDFYTYSMGQAIVLNRPQVEVDFRLTNRSRGVVLTHEVSPDELAQELDRLKVRRFTRTELHYVLGTNEYGERMFRSEYIDHLRELALPDFHLGVRDDGQFDLRFPGVWSRAMHWEVPALAAINGLRMRNALRRMTPFQRDEVIARGVARLGEKIRVIRELPGLTFTDFGTRRRFHRAWQRYIDKTLAQELPGQFLGTSNVEAAMDFGLLPMGTNAHQMFMVIAALMSETDESLLRSHNQALREWWQLYGWGLSIALTDTFGTDFFFRDFTPEQARAWKGLRQDSGDPIVFGHKALDYYHRRGIDPKEKLLIFSDGLDLDMIVRLYNEFKNEIKVSFGWGTLLTNDLGLSPISIVIKAMRARRDAGSVWIDTCKLSDNIAKAMGTRETIDRYARVFGYDSHFEETPIV